MSSDQPPPQFRPRQFVLKVQVRWNNRRLVLDGNHLAVSYQVSGSKPPACYALQLHTPSSLSTQQCHRAISPDQFSQMTKTISHHTLPTLKIAFLSKLESAKQNMVLGHILHGLVVISFAVVVRTSTMSPEYALKVSCIHFEGTCYTEFDDKGGRLRKVLS